MVPPPDRSKRSALTDESDSVPTRTWTRPPTAQVAVVAELRRAIAERELHPGDRIGQDAVARRFGVSPIPVREALKILEGEGQVVYRPHHGYFVVEFSAEDMDEITRICELLETEALLRSIAEVTAEDLARLETFMVDADVAAQEGDVGTALWAYRSFYFNLFELAEMPILVRHIQLVWNATNSYRALYYNDPEHRREMHGELKAIRESVESGDADALIQVVDKYRQRFFTGVRELVSDD